MFGAEKHYGLRFGLTNVGPEAAFYLSPEIEAGQVRLLPTGRFGAAGSNFGLSLRYDFKDK